MKRIISAAIVSAGIALAGVCMYLGMQAFATKDRSVSVKGLSVRDVQSDHVVWPLSFSLEGNNLPELYSQIGQMQTTVYQLLKSKGFETSDLSTGGLQVSDQWEGYYDHKPEYRYRISSSVVVSTDDVQKVIDNFGCESELLSSGVIVSSDSWSLDYQYNGLSDLKPEMVEEATKNAREVAQKFADDAECTLGSILHASQGQFSIDDDPYQPWVKHVRVVTTVDYMLR